jgi:chaperonin cofactor prefoldin
VSGFESDEQRIAALEREVTELRAELEQLRAALAAAQPRATQHELIGGCALVGLAEA